MESQKKTDRKKTQSPKPYNNYNLFFILERARILEGKQTGAIATSNRSNKISHSTLHDEYFSTKRIDDIPQSLSGYEFIDLPPLPPRYQHLQSVLPEDWYDSVRNRLTKRKHKKTHGMVSFQEMAKTVAINWKAVDPLTKNYVETFAALLKGRHEELRQIGGLRYLSVVDQRFPISSCNNSTSEQMIQRTRLQNGVRPSRIQIPLTQETAQPEMGRIERTKADMPVQLPSSAVSQANSHALDDLTFSSNQIVLATHLEDDFMATLTLEQVILNNRQHSEKCGRTCSEVDLCDTEIIKAYRHA